jgi:hypothetical protein
MVWTPLHNYEGATRAQDSEKLGQRERREHTQDDIELRVVEW